MPNGGSDNCGTCWFNAPNKGKSGYDNLLRNGPGFHSLWGICLQLIPFLSRFFPPDPDFCTIRGTEIENCMYTYCGNHPYRRPDRDPIPIGPIYLFDLKGTHGRQAWLPSPDSEAIRVHLLGILQGIDPHAKPEYSSGLSLAEVVVRQLGEFRERRAIPELNRITACGPRDDGTHPKWTISLVAAARESLAKIEGNSAAE